MRPGEERQKDSRRHVWGSGAEWLDVDSAVG